MNLRRQGTSMLRGTGNSVANFTIDKFHECEECRGSGEIESKENNGDIDRCGMCSGRGYYEKWS